MIRFENVSKVYRANGHRRTFLEQVSFTLKPGISYRATAWQRSKRLMRRKRSVTAALCG